MDKLCINANNKEKTVTIYFDVEKAFNYDWHKVLLHKLHSIVTPVLITEIINSLLHNRSFRVRYCIILSRKRPIIQASVCVPQGSCHSLLLNLVYTNEIPVNLKTSLVLFADDSLFYSSDKNQNRVILYLQN